MQFCIIILQLCTLGIIICILKTSKLTSSSGITRKWWRRVSAPRSGWLSDSPEHILSSLLHGYQEKRMHIHTCLFYFDLFWSAESDNESHSVLSNSLWPHGLDSLRNSLGQNTGVGSLSLLQGILPTQKSKWSLLHCRWILYQLSSQGSSHVHLLVYFIWGCNEKLSKM